ncbi:hypothetical protein AAC387_Pa07g1056 [Persea americana]
MAEEEEVGAQNETIIWDDGNGLDRDRKIVDRKKLKRKKDKKMRRFFKEAAMADKRGVCYLADKTCFGICNMGPTWMATKLSALAELSFGRVIGRLPKTLS